MAEALEKWAEEMEIKKNSLSSFSYRKLTKGQMANVCKFLTAHVKPVRTVQKIRMNLELNGVSVNPSQDLIMVERDMLEKEKAKLNNLIEKATAALQPVRQNTLLLAKEKRNSTQELIEVQRQSSEHHQSAYMLREFIQNSHSLADRYLHKIDQIRKILALRHKTPCNGKKIDTIYFTRDTGDCAKNPVLETAMTRGVREICEAIQNTLSTHDEVNSQNPESFFNKRRNLIYKNVVALQEENSVCEILNCLNGLQQERLETLRTVSEKFDFENDAKNLHFRYLPCSSTSNCLKDLQSDPDVFRDIRDGILVKFMKWQQMNLSIKTMSARYEFIKDQLQQLLEKMFATDPGNLKLARQVVESQLEKEFSKACSEELEVFRKNLTEEVARDMESQQVKMSKYEDIKNMQYAIVNKQETIRTLFACVTEYDCKLENYIQTIIKFITTNIRQPPERIQSLQNSLSSEVELFCSLPLSLLILAESDGQVFLSPNLDISERMLCGQFISDVYNALGLIDNKPPEKVLPELVSQKKRAFQTQQTLQSQVGLLDKLLKSYSCSGTEAECRFTKESLTDLKKKLQKRWKQRALTCGLKQQHVLLDNGFKSCLDLATVIEIWWELPARNITVPGSLIAGND